MTLNHTEKSASKDKVSYYQPKKLLIMNILDILRKYTDADHRISQKILLIFLKTNTIWSLTEKLSDATS